MSRINDHRLRVRGGFTLVEIMVASGVSFVVFAGILAAYLFLGRNLTRLVNLQQQDAQSRGMLRQFTQDVSAACQVLTTTNAANLDLVSGFVMLSGGGATTAATATINFNSSTGQIASFNITSPGSGYTAAPTVAITSGGGSGGTATATISTGQITGINITAAGTGYTSPPTVTITSGGGTGGTATATVSGGQITGINITAAGTGYTAAPTVTIAGGGGTGGTAAATFSIGRVTAITPVSSNITKVSYDYTAGNQTLTRTATNTPATRTVSGLTVCTFTYYNEAGTVTSIPQSIKAIELSFSTATGSSASGTLARYTMASPRVILRNKPALQ